MLRSINLKSTLKEIRDKRVSLSQDIFYEISITDYSRPKINQFYPEKLDSDAIYHNEDIKKLCIDYRLRFLDYEWFKGSIPIEAIDKIKNLEKVHDTNIQGLKIVAPSKSFRLKNADDPLLFANMGNDFYYLIHKWGNDLHPFRKMMMWPYKNFENLMFTIFLTSILLTLFIPNGLFAKNPSISQTFIVFLFMFKWVAAIVLYYGFAFGKNFNNQMWNSKYFNA